MVNFKNKCVVEFFPKVKYIIFCIILPCWVLLHENRLPFFKRRDVIVLKHHQCLLY